MNRKKLTVFLVLLVVYAFSAFATYAFFSEAMTSMLGVPMPKVPISSWFIWLRSRVARCMPGMMLAKQLFSR